LFLVSIRFTTLRIALAVQLQPSRALWILDLIATVYLVWLLAEGAAAVSRSRTAAVAAVLIVASAARGVYVLEKTSRSILRYEPADTPWQDVMRWAETNTPKNAQWLAHPGHAYLYGTSVRVSARRDVFLEETKDAAIAMYDRGVALRVVERSRAIGDFDALTPETARALAARYDIKYMVTERALPLPVLYRNAQFSVYELQ
jgi:asparagine N-glycosylation enzyme membrane subunit Stt3